MNRECRVAGIGCIDCKTWMTDHLLKEISPLLERRKQYEQRKDEIQDVIEEGNSKARVVAKQTMEEVRKAVKMT